MLKKNKNIYIWLFMLNIFITPLMLRAGASFGMGFDQNIRNIVEVYRNFGDLGNISNIEVPTVVEVPLPNNISIKNRSNFFIVLGRTSALMENFLDNERLYYYKHTFEPYYIHTQMKEIPILVSSGYYNDSSLSQYISNGRDISISDNNTLSFTEFPFTDNSGELMAQVIFNANTPVRSSIINFTFGENVVLPRFIAIEIMGEEDKNRIVLAKTPMRSSVVRFPETISKNWIVRLYYNQPLRIAEVRLDQSKAQKSIDRGLRFLAQPKYEYGVYMNPIKDVDVILQERANLQGDIDVLKFSRVIFGNNVTYKDLELDIDNDGILDKIDNCISLPNSDQVDINDNGIGDICDDFDKDGVMNIKDNCPNNPNRNQQDVDGDGIGDVCDDEESRITEQNPWIPWAGIGFAGFILVALFTMVAKQSTDKSINEM